MSLAVSDRRAACSAPCRCLCLPWDNHHRLPQLAALSVSTPRRIWSSSMLEERAEVAFAEALVALALDDLEEDGPDHGLGEDLQQQLVGRTLVRGTVDEDAQALQLIQILAMAGQAFVDEVVVRVDRVLECDAVAPHCVDHR